LHAIFIFLTCVISSGVSLDKGDSFFLFLNLCLSLFLAFNLESADDVVPSCGKGNYVVDEDVG